VEPVLRFFPYYRLWTIYYFSRNLFASMRWEAMHEQCILLRAGHHFRIYPKIGKIFFPLLGFRLESHTRPDVGRHEVGVLYRIVWISEFLVVAGAIKPGPFRFHFIAG